MSSKIKIVNIILIVVAIIIVIGLAIIFYNIVIKKDKTDTDNKETDITDEILDPINIDWNYDDIAHQDMDISLDKDSYKNKKISTVINNIDIDIGSIEDINKLCITPNINNNNYYAILCECDKGYINYDFSDYYDILNYDRNSHIYIKDSYEWKFRKISDYTDIYWESTILDEIKKAEVYYRLFNLETFNIDYVIQITIEKDTDNKYYVSNVESINIFEKEHLELLNNAIQNSNITILKNLDINNDIIETITNKLCFYKTNIPNEIHLASMMDIDTNEFPLRMFTLNYKKSLVNIYLDKNNNLIAYDNIYYDNVVINTFNSNQEYLDEYRDIAIQYNLIKEDEDNREYQDGNYKMPEDIEYTPDPEQVNAEWEYMQEQIRKNQEEAEKEQQEQGGEIGDAEVP